MRYEEKNSWNGAFNRAGWVDETQRDECQFGYNPNLTYTLFVTHAILVFVLFYPPSFLAFCLTEVDPLCSFFALAQPARADSIICRRDRVSRKLLEYTVDKSPGTTDGVYHAIMSIALKLCCLEYFFLHWRALHFTWIQWFLFWSCSLGARYRWELDGFKNCLFYQ